MTIAIRYTETIFIVIRKRIVGLTFKPCYLHRK